MIYARPVTEILLYKYNKVYASYSRLQTKYIKWLAVGPWSPKFGAVGDKVWCGRRQKGFYEISKEIRNRFYQTHSSELKFTFTIWVVGGFLSIVKNICFMIKKIIQKYRFYIMSLKRT